MESQCRMLSGKRKRRPIRRDQTALTRKSESELILPSDERDTAAQIRHGDRSTPVTDVPDILAPSAEGLEAIIPEVAQRNLLACRRGYQTKRRIAGDANI